MNEMFSCLDLFDWMMISNIFNIVEILSAIMINKIKDTLIHSFFS